jgi:hypothetical protein
MNSNCIQFSHSHPASKTSNCRTVRICIAAAIGLAVAAVNTAYAQVSTVNSVIVETNALPPGAISNGLPSLDLTEVDSYPSLISFSVTNAGATNPSSAFCASQDFWQFSVSGQTNAYMFQSNDYFTATMSITLTGDPISPRKEAGFAFNDVNGDINGQYILDTDNHECVVFGGNLPFWNSNPVNAHFESGETVTMGITIFKDSSGNNAIIYSANGFDSPAFEFGTSAVGPPQPYTLGGYFQIQGQDTGSTNSGAVVFQNISIGTPLNIGTLGANSAVVYWPASSTPYVLQTSTNLSSTNWTTVNGEPITGVLVPGPSSNSYYRLIAP